MRNNKKNNKKHDVKGAVLFQHPFFKNGAVSWKTVKHLPGWRFWWQIPVRQHLLQSRWKRWILGTDLRVEWVPRISPEKDHPGPKESNMTHDIFKPLKHGMVGILLFFLLLGWPIFRGELLVSGSVKVCCLKMIFRSYRLVGYGYVAQEGVGEMMVFRMVLVWCRRLKKSKWYWRSDLELGMMGLSIFPLGLESPKSQTRSDLSFSVQGRLFRI